MEKRTLLLRFLYPVYVILLLEIGSLTTATLLSMTPEEFDSTVNYASVIAMTEEERPQNPSRNELTGWDEFPHPYFGASYPHEKKNVPRKEFNQLGDFGFKDDAGPVVTKREPNQFIITVLGGSVARGFMDYQGGEVLRRELQKDPYFKGKEIIFSPLAYYGHKQPQQLMALMYMLTMGAKFDMVVSIDGFNELTFGKVYNEGPNLSPYYPFKWHWFLTQAMPDSQTQAMADDIRFLKRKQREMAERFASSPLKWTATASLAWQIMNNRYESQISHAMYELSTNAPNELQHLLDSGPQPNYASTDEYLRDQVSLWEESTRQVGRIAKANNMLHLAVLQPNQYYGDRQMSAKEARFAYNPESHFIELVEKGYPMIIKAGKRLEREGISFHDATDVFDDHPEVIYTDDCCHFTVPMPNAILAKRIAEVVINSLVK